MMLCGFYRGFAMVTNLNSKARSYDVVFCAKTFIKTFEDAQKSGTLVIPLKNVMSAPEIEKALKENGYLE